MPDYEPLDLSPLYNAGAAFYQPGPRIWETHPPASPPPTGPQVFHGLPFEIGADPDRCFIALAGDSGLQSGAVEAPIGKTARWVIFAHALLESNLLEGETPGAVVARYTFHYEDGETVEAPVRDRFEVAGAPAIWGDGPFLAHPDRKNWLMPRKAGPWDEMGERQAEAMQADPLGYHLWAWQNPRPDVPLRSVSIAPAGRRFVVAAITLGHLDEHPFPRAGRLPVIVTLPRAEDASAPFDLEVEVDRGVATYPYPLPQEPAEAFLAGDLRGWGQAQNAQASPAYVEIAAIPSATVTVKNAGQELGSARWGDLLERGAAETPGARLEVLQGGKNWVHVTVLDDETGRPVPCRVHFRSPHGVPYQPHGHHNHVNANLDSWHSDVGGDLRLGQITYAYIDGKCQGWLPRGEALVDAARGFEYEPLRARVQIEPGQRELTLRLKRAANLNAEGWYSGDSHVHFLGAQGAFHEAQGKDLDVVNLLASQWGHLFTNTEDFTGRPAVSEDGGTIVYCSQENRQHLLGHLILWGLKEPVMPWCSDGPSEAEIGGTLDETMSAWADACHAQGGTVVLPHFPRPNGEPAALVAAGRVDAVEWLRHSPFNHHEYYRYLNCGYRLPLVGGTDKMTSDVPVGLYRTYARLASGEAFNYENWCSAVRAGRTFLSGGPLLRFSVEGGAQIGDTLRLPKGGGTVEVEAEAQSIFPIHTLEIVQAGRVVASTEEAGGARTLRLKAALKVEGHTWLAARCAGPGYAARAHHDGWGRGIFAHTSPVYVAAGGEWEMFDAPAAQYMLTLVEGTLQYIRQTAAHHPPGTVTYHHGEADHLAYLERPFQQALEALHRRMHAAGVSH